MEHSTIKAGPRVGAAPSFGGGVMRRALVAAVALMLILPALASVLAGAVAVFATGG